MGGARDSSNYVSEMASHLYPYYGMMNSAWNTYGTMAAMSGRGIHYGE